MSKPESAVEQPTDTTQHQLSDPAEQSSDNSESLADTEESCNADAFMDEEDSEAVAERLRQLGYI